MLTRKCSLLRKQTPFLNNNDDNNNNNNDNNNNNNNSNNNNNNNSNNNKENNNKENNNNDNKNNNNDNNNNNNNDDNSNNWSLYSAISIHKMYKSAAYCHSLSLFHTSMTLIKRTGQHHFDRYNPNHCCLLDMDYLGGLSTYVSSTPIIM